MRETKNTQQNKMLKGVAQAIDKTSGFILDEWPPKCSTLFHQPKRPVDKIQKQ